MRALSMLRAHPKHLFMWFLCVGALALTGGERATGTTAWKLGDLVVCGTANGQCTIYDGATASASTISVPSNPKRDLGGVAWLSSFDLLVADATNEQVLKFSRVGAHAATVLIDTSAHGTPGPLVVDSAGTVYVGLSDAGKILARAFDATSTTPTVASDLSLSGIVGIQGMDLADNHTTMWFTSGATLYSVNVSGTANLQPFALSGPGGDVRVIEGSSELLVAVGNEIRRLSAAAPATVLDTYDLGIGDEGWRALAIEPDGDHFLATTAAGGVYRFALDGDGSPTSATPLIPTGSTKVTSLTEKGSPQLNIRPIRFRTTSMTAETNALREATFGNPAGGKGDSFAPHQFGLLTPTLHPDDDFIAVVSATWVKGNGVCPAGATAATDYDCRVTQLGPGPLPRCIPYVTSNSETCVFYRLEDEDLAWQLNDGTELGGLLRSIDYLIPVSFASGNPRLLRDPPDSDSQFTEDITIGLTKTATSDPLFGEGRGGSDYGAFDREPRVGDTAGIAIATILKPLNGSAHQTGRSVPFEVTVTAGGTPVLDAVAGTNSMSLFVEYLGNPAAIYLHPQPTPGGSPEFFVLSQVKSGKTTSYVYRGNFDLSGKPIGNYVACVSSIDTASAKPGQFAPVCVEFSVKAK